MDKMRQKIGSDVAVIFVSHNLAAVASLCDRAILLNKGDMVTDGPCEETIDAYVRTMTSWVSKSEIGDRKIRIVDAEFKAGAGQRPGMMQPHTHCECW